MLIEWIVSASALAAVMLLLRLAFRKRISQRLQYVLWLPVLLRLLIPVPLFSAPISVTGAAERIAPAAFTQITPVSRVPEVTPTPAPVPAGEVQMRPTAAPALPQATAPVAPAPTPTPAKTMNWGELLSALWLAGSVAAGLWLAWVNLRFARRLCHSRKVLREEGTPVYVSEEVSSPCLFGLPPAIYLTPACAEGPEERLSQVLLHEETHRKQGDHIWGCLRCLCLAVWWWNPLVWLSAILSRRDGELSCDERVMKALGEEARLDYGRTLVELLPERTPRPLLTAATLSGGGRAMKERLNMILKKPRFWAVAAAAALLLAAVAAGCAFAGQPEAAEPAVTPTPAPTVTPASTPESFGGTELLMGDTKRERVKSIVYSMSIGDKYTLESGDEGFDEALDALFSLRGEPCEKPEALVSRSFDLGVGPIISLAFDGERVYGQRLTDHWLLLEGEGRIDQVLTEIFLRWGSEEVSLVTYPSRHGGKVEDENITLETEYPSYDLGALLAAIDRFKTDYRLSGRSDQEPLPDFILKLKLENNSEETLHFGQSVDLEVLLDGEWRLIPMREGYGFYLIEYGIEPGGAYTDLGVFLQSYYKETLTPGLYRACLPYRLGEDGKEDHVVYAEFELTDGADIPTPTPTPEGALSPAIDRSGMIMDDSVTISLDRTVFALETIRENAAALEEKGVRGGAALTEDYWDSAAVWVDLENRSSKWMSCDFPELEALRDGVWYHLPYDYIGYPLGYATASGSSHRNYVPLAETDMENLLPGRYRVCVTYCLGEADSKDEWAFDHVIYAEFDIVEREGLLTPSIVPDPTPTPEPTPTPTPEPTPAPFVPVTVEQWTDWLTLPEDARWLTEEEIQTWTEWFDGDWMRRQFLTSEYERPQDVDLWKLFYMGVDLREVSFSDYESGRELADDVDIVCGLRHLGRWDETIPTDRMHSWAMDELLGKYLGLGLGEMSGVGLAFTYLPETGCFYHPHLDGNYQSWPFRYGYVQGDEISLFYQKQPTYHDILSGMTGYAREGIYRVVLRREGEGTRFRSNLRCLYNGTEAAFETPELAETYPVTPSGDYSRNITTVTLEPETFESYEAAQAAIDEMGFRFSQAEDPYPFERKLEREVPGYGTLVYGEVGTGTVHGPNSYLFLVTPEGLRYMLPTPHYGMGDIDMDMGIGLEAMEGNRYFLEEPSGLLISWWMYCKYEIYPSLGSIPRRDGMLYYTLWLPAMEVYVYFEPDA